MNISQPIAPRRSCGGRQSGLRVQIRLDGKFLNDHAYVYFLLIDGQCHCWTREQIQRCHGIVNAYIHRDTVRRLSIVESCWDVCRRWVHRNVISDLNLYTIACYDTKVVKMT